MDGETLWAGYSGILERIPGNNYDTVYAEFLSPSWDKESNVTAQVKCSGAHSSNFETVTLTMTGTDWRWIPKPQCRGHK